MTDLECLYITWFNLDLCPLFCPFLLCIAALINCDIWASPPEFYPRRFSRSWSCFLAHSSSLSFAPSLPPIPVVFRNFSSGATAFSFSSKVANHLLSTYGCQVIPSFFNSRTSFLLYFLHFRHRAYRCSTVCSVSPHHQHSGVSITPTLTRKVPTAPCPTFS